MKKKTGKNLLREFRAMQARAYSNISLQRPLSPSEFKSFKSAFGDAYPQAYKKLYGKKKGKMKLTW
jgi:hypothetical protein